MVGRTYKSEDLIALSCEYDLGKYLRTLFRLTFGIKLQKPSRSEHILITFPGEIFSYKEDTLQFELNNQVFTNGNAFWVDVISTDISNYRKSLGLSIPPRNVHFCIGYIK